MFLSPQHARRDPKDIEYPGQPLLQGQIRLVRLLPGAWTDPIQCELFEEAHGTTKYEALSYVWGSQNVTRPIFLNRKEFRVTFNLEGALRHLREHFKNDDKAKVFWIDALCINQKDTQERTNQVQLMGDIYKICEQVVVYLGDRLDGRPRPKEPPATIKFSRYERISNDLYDGDADLEIINIFTLFQDFIQHNHITEMPALNERCCVDESSINMKSKANCDDRSKLFESLRRMMHPPFTPWWSRVWVIQEVTVAPKVLLVYGTCSAPWKMVYGAALSYTNHSSYCCSKVVANLPRDQTNVLADFCSRVLGIAESRLRSGERAAEYSLIRNDIPLSLLDLLRKFRDRRASDPRDKVYALLSLPRIPTTKPRLIPDYSLTEVEVFRQATLQCIYETGNLSVFSSDLGRKFRNDLPSWVPDWDAPGGPTYEARAVAADLYNAMPFIGAEFETVVRPAGKVGLLVEALKIGTILKVDDAMWGADAPCLWQTTLLRWNVAAVTFHAGKTNGMQDFWRLICGDVISRHHGMRQQGSRAQKHEELWFMMWASTSPKSPFILTYDDDIFWPMLQDGYWSTETKIWKAVQLLWPVLPWPDPELPVNLELLKDWIRGLNPEDLVPYGVVSLEGPDNAVRMLLHLLEEDLGTEILVSPGFSGDWKDLPWQEILIHSVRRIDLGFGYGVNLNPEFYRGRVHVFDNSIMAATLSRRLIMSDRYIGLGPAGAKEGDELFFLKGGKTPFVLRETSAQPDLTGPKYELVGDCYIQGLMDSNNIAKDDPRGKWVTITLV